MTETNPASPDTAAENEASAPGEPVAEPVEQVTPPAAEAGAPASVEQSSLAAPAPAPRGLTYAVDIVFCIDVTGSMTPILDQVKANALRFYGDVQSNLVAKGKNIDELRVRCRSRRSSSSLLTRRGSASSSTAWFPRAGATRRSRDLRRPRSR